MSNTEGQLRISLLNAPDDMAPLKLRGWLRTEAVDIQSMARGEHDLIIIRLFMPERLRLAITQKKLDGILQEIVDKFPNIHRVELQSVTGVLPKHAHEAAAYDTWLCEKVGTSLAGLQDGSNPVIPPAEWERIREQKRRAFSARR